jgi:hypothetical protein
MTKSLLQKSWSSVLKFILLTSFKPLLSISTISSEADLITALNSGSGTYTLTANITLTQPTIIPLANF